MLHIIIQLVLKKELTRFTNKSPKTLDIHEVKLQYSNRKTVEINLIQTVTSNMEVIKNKTISINQLIDDVFDSDHQKEIDFICNWNNFNKKRLQDIKLRKTRITNVKMECSAMFHHAKKLLTSKKRQITTQYNESINELFEFFQNQFLENSLQIECSLGINDRVNYECLVQLLHAMIPFINNYIKNFSYGGAETIPYEKRVISKFCSEMKELYSEISAFSRRYEMDSVSSLKNSSIRSLLNEDDIQIKPYIVNTPSSKFDFTEMCINLGKFNGNRLTLIGEDQENPLNRTKLFRMQQLTPKSSNKNSIYSAENTMVAPVPLMNKGAIRKRRDPLAILEKATQSKTQTQQNKRNEYNTNYQLSSTMLSPAEGRLNRENPDFSRISSISSIKISPVIPDDFTYRNNYENQNNNKFLSTIIQHQHKNQNTSPLAFKHMLPEVKLFETTPKSSPVSSNYKRKGINPVNFLQCPPSGSHIQMSPTGKLDSLVSHGDILPPPKLFLNNSSFATDLEQVGFTSVLIVVYSFLITLILISLNSFLMMI